MDALKQLDIQRQIKNNNEDFQSYARELKLWETEMKRKDRELGEQSNKKDIPPIRKKSKKDEGVLKEVKPKRISAYDYTSWDKFDVDKACEELEKEDSDEDVDTDVEEEDLDRIATAVYKKEQGNKLVKEGKWGEAIEKYNDAIQTYPHDAVFHANRALCFLKMKNYVSAEADCTSSLRLDTSYVKAYLRRATARRALNQFVEARNDLLKVIVLEPQNKQVENELLELNKKLNIPMTADNEISKAVLETVTKSSNMKMNKSEQSISNMNAGGFVDQCLKPPDLSWVPLYNTSQYSIVPRVVIPPYQRSKKPLVKLNVDPDISSTNSSVVTNTTCIIEERTSKIQIIDEKDDSSIIKQEVDDKIDPITECEERRKKLEMLEQVWNEMQNANPYKKKPDEYIKISPEVDVEFKNVSVKKPPTPVIPTPAKTCSQFELHWRTLKSSDENLYLYLKQFNGHDLPSIFKEGLETSTFIDIIKCLCGKFLENNDPIGDFVQGLASTPRLASLVMFMSQSEKSLLSKLLLYCEDKSELSSESLESLKRAFEL